MKISKIILPLVGLCALTSCGTKTSKNNFFEAAKDVESHSYKSYVVKYSEESNTGSIETKVSYTFKDNQWDADQINSYTMSFSTYSSPMVTYADDYETYLDYYEEDAKSEDSNAKIEKEVRYYIKPFKIVVSFNCSYKNEKGSGKELMEIKEEYNKYGYLTFRESTHEYSQTKEEDGRKITKKNKSHSKLEIAYKD